MSGEDFNMTAEDKLIQQLESRINSIDGPLGGLGKICLQEIKSAHNKPETVVILVDRESSALREALRFIGLIEYDFTYGSSPNKFPELICPVRLHIENEFKEAQVSSTSMPAGEISELIKDILQYLFRDKPDNDKPIKFSEDIYNYILHLTFPKDLYIDSAHYYLNKVLRLSDEEIERDPIRELLRTKLQTRLQHNEQKNKKIESIECEHDVAKYIISTAGFYKDVDITFPKEVNVNLCKEFLQVPEFIKEIILIPVNIVHNIDDLQIGAGSQVYEIKESDRFTIWIRNEHTGMRETLANTIPAYKALCFKYMWKATLFSYDVNTITENPSDKQLYSLLSAICKQRQHHYLYTLLTLEDSLRNIDIVLYDEKLKCLAEVVASLKCNYIREPDLQLLRNRLRHSIFREDRVDVRKWIQSYYESKTDSKLFFVLKRALFTFCIESYNELLMTFENRMQEILKDDPIFVLLRGYMPKKWKDSLPTAVENWVCFILDTLLADKSYWSNCKHSHYKKYGDAHGNPPFYEYFIDCFISKFKPRFSAILRGAISEEYYNACSSFYTIILEIRQDPCKFLQKVQNE